MLERLKSLPLTIVLTILIWMYAESQVNSSHAILHLSVDVPVRVTGSPNMLARYDVTINPQVVALSLTGPPEQIDALRREAPVQGVYAYLDLSPDDRPAGISIPRQLRIDLPAGVTLDQPGIIVSFRLETKPANAASLSTDTRP